MDWQLGDAAQRCATAIAVSKLGHCLNDLLHRASTGTLSIDVKAVVLNHQDMRRLVERHGLTFQDLPVSAETKTAQERTFSNVLFDAGTDLLVLARYMQILAPDFATQLSGRCINIHHSFLPRCKGARPYHQARARGVKITSATTHYVSADLDDGPDHRTGR